ncbi:interleukin-6 receptor subunit beta-like isoform X2 [Aquarana catesbeiana]|uniref:interleukin-6 receptor subunit beta-like isoform X2 n=1 Tax=Aquarana catesbeiana TaxID=8400 RepID=UPI003CC9F571
MICIFLVLLTIYCKPGYADDCVVLPNCHESPDNTDREWQDGIFCYPVLSESGVSLRYVNCSWLPYQSFPSKEYKQQLVWWNDIDSGCMELDAGETTKRISNTIFSGKEDKLVHKIWVSHQISEHECLKTNNFTIIPWVNCPTPRIQYAAQSANVFKFQLDNNGQLRYREMETNHWYTINATNRPTNVSLPETSKPFVFQQRCLSESCFHCRWTQEKPIPRELTGSPEVAVITEKLSPGKQRVFIEWKYAMHVYVDKYNVMIQRLPNSCGINIFHQTNSTNFLVNLSVAFFNVSVTAFNEAGNTLSASTLVQPLTSPELPGKIFATYKNDKIFLTWLPLFYNDFCVISWGTNYMQMKSNISMTRIHNYSIHGPFDGLKRYTIMIHLHDLNKCMNSTRETTFGITYIYVEEGVPRTGSPNVTIKSITKTSAVVEWKEIPEEDCLGFLLFYRIFCTDVVRNITQEITVNSSSIRSYQIEDLRSGQEYHVRVSGVTVKGTGPPSATVIFKTLYYAEGEFQVIIISACVGLMVVVVIAICVCAYILKRTKNWYFPQIPNPRHSHLSRINEEAGTKIKLGQLLQTQEEVSCGNMDVEVIEKVSVLSTPPGSCTQLMEFNMYSDYQNQWCPPAHTLLTQGDTTMSMPQTAHHINEGGSEAIQRSEL